MRREQERRGPRHALTEEPELDHRDRRRRGSVTHAAPTTGSGSRYCVKEVPRPCLGKDAPVLAGVKQSALDAGCGSAPVSFRAEVQVRVRVDRDVRRRGGACQPERDQTDEAGDERDDEPAGFSRDPSRKRAQHSNTPDRRHSSTATPRTGDIVVSPHCPNPPGGRDSTGQIRGRGDIGTHQFRRSTRRHTGTHRRRMALRVPTRPTEKQPRSGALAGRPTRRGVGRSTGRASSGSRSAGRGYPGACRRSG